MRFLNAIEAEVSIAEIVHVILCNYARHEHPKTEASLDRHPRSMFPLPDLRLLWSTPSRVCFAKDQAPSRRGAFRSIVELCAAIDRFRRGTNDNPKLFPGLHQIITAAGRGHQPLDPLY